MNWKARQALHQRLVQLQKLAEPHLSFLMEALSPLGPDDAEELLRANRVSALDVASAGSNRSRLLASLPESQLPWAAYAAAAWTARALILAEHLEALQLEPDRRGPDAADAFLTLIGRYEDEPEAWLWPFPGVSPWDLPED